MSTNELKSGVADALKLLREHRDSIHDCESNPVSGAVPDDARADIDRHQAACDAIENQIAETAELRRARADLAAKYDELLVALHGIGRALGIEDVRGMVSVQAEPAGWKAVPVDPTPGMVDAADSVNWCDGDTRGSVINMWHLMLAAVPVQAGPRPRPLPCPFCSRDPDEVSRPNDATETEFFAALACYCGGYSACAYQSATAPTQAEADRLALHAWNSRANQKKDTDA